MPATNAWDETKPAGTDSISLGDDAIRQFKLDVRERLALQHYWNANQTDDGKHAEMTIKPKTTNVDLLATEANQSLTGAATNSLINMAATWNVGTATPTAVLITITDTASGAASLLMNLKVGSNSKFSVDKSGNVTFAGTLNLAAPIDVSGTNAGAVVDAGHLRNTGTTTNTAVDLWWLAGTGAPSASNGIGALRAIQTGAGPTSDFRFFTNGGSGMVEGMRLTSGSWLQFPSNNSGSAPAGAISKHSSNGLFITGATGSVFDFALTNPSGANGIMTVPTGTLNIQFGGAVTLNGTAGILTLNGVTSAAATLVLTQTGTADVGGIVLQRSAGTTSVWQAYIPTGSTDLRFYNAGDRFTFAASGQLTISAGLVVSSGNIQIPQSTTIFASTGDVFIRAGSSGGILRLGANGSNNFWEIDASGNLCIGSSAHIALSSGTPTIGSGFGTSPSIAGTDYAFAITVGGGANTGGTVTFAHTWSTAPICVLATDVWGNIKSGGVNSLPNQSPHVTTTTLSLTWDSGTFPTQVVYVHCFGY